MTIRRPAAVAGLFYPADPAMLRADVERRLAEARVAAGPAPRADAPPKLLVVPHAGHVYSGACAARAYALLEPWRDRISRVVLLGPTHRVAVRGLAAPTVDAFDTPMGAVPLDRAALAAIADLPQVVASDRAHAQEHALEVQLPFLQAVLGRFALVPLAVGDASAAEVAQAVERLWGGDETLVVVSTDLSHFLPDARARALDAATMDRILRFDERIGHDEACGATPLAGALRVARTHGLEPRLLDLRHSGDAGGDPDRVVGYGAAAFRPAANARLAAGAGAAEAARAGPSGPRLDDPRLDDARLDDPLLGRALLGRARNAIAAALGLAQRVPEPWHDALARPGATFVTLRHEAALRGCVGRIEPGPHALDEDVRRNARSAAFDDPRFEPLAAHAFDGLEIEVSLLGAVEPVPAASQAEAVRRLRPGEDGVVLDWRGRRSTFLPQVWAELPDAHAFLAALKRKAGLPGGAWFPDLALGRYSVVKFTDAGGRP